MVDKSPIENPKLSMKAKGLLCYLLSKPPDWRPNIKDICKHCTEKEGSIRRAFRELASAGHASLIRESEKSGRFYGTRWVIKERPDLTKSTEIAVSRVSENNHLTKNDKCSKKALQEVSCFQKAIDDGRFRKEDVVQEAKGLISSVLKLNPGDPFFSQWQERAEHAPFRTELAIGSIQDDLAAKTRVNNRAAKANWFYLHTNLENGRVE